MITGLVSIDREPLVQISVHDVGGHEHQHTAIVDTAYTGWLTLPSDVIASLGLPWRERGGATLADGSRALFDVYDATVVWDGKLILIPVDEVDADSLVGMSLMDGYELYLPVFRGATFTLQVLTTAPITP